MGDVKRYAYDTNALLLKPDALSLADEIIIPYKVLQELDRIKMEDSSRGWQAREAVRRIEEVEDKVTYELEVAVNGIFNNNDDYIVESARKYESVMITGDKLVQQKCKAHGVPVIRVSDLDLEREVYTGYKEVVVSDYQLAKFYENVFENHFDLFTNQYLILKNEWGEIIDTLKWNGQLHDNIQFKKSSIQSLMFGKLTPKDIFQQCVMDSFNHNAITMVKGKAGSGKSLLALSYAWSQIEKSSKFDKLICFVNPMAARNSAKLGFYPGTRDEKLLDSAVGSMLASKFGDKNEVQHQINNGKVLLLPFSDIRGFDTTGMKAIVWIVEAQNLDIDLMKLAAQRIGEDSKLIIDGDYETQVDSGFYEGSKNGMRRLSKVFRGELYYGEVELPNIYRSKIALKADEM